MADLNSKLTKKGTTKMSTTIKQHLKDKGYTKAIKYAIKPIIDEIKQLKEDLKSSSKRLLNEDNISIDLARTSLDISRVAENIVAKEKQLDVAVKTLLYAVDDNEEIWEFVNNWIKLETKFIYSNLFEV